MARIESKLFLACLYYSTTADCFVYKNLFSGAWSRFSYAIEYMDGIGKARHAWVQKYEIRIRKQNVLHKTFMVIGYLTSSLYSKL